MKKTFLKIIGLTFVLAILLNVALAQRGDPEFPPLLGANTITQLHLS